MANSILKAWNPFKTRLERMGLGISGTYFPIRDIPRYEDELGYTSSNKEIHLAPDHPIMDKMTKEERFVFIQGVFSHELMHQLNTDFKAYEERLNKLPKFQQKIFNIIFNIMEDPAIEYWAKEYFEGSLLSSLHYSVNIVYKNLPEIDKKSEPLNQFIMACIHYGDGGLLKGDFGSDLAKECFYKALPILDKTIEEPTGKIRVQHALDVFYLTKPLWIDDVKNAEAFQKFMDGLMDELKKEGKNFEDGKSGGSPIGGTIPGGSSEDPALEKKKKRRKITFKKISKKEAEQMAAGASEGPMDMDGDITVYVVEDDKKAEESKTDKRDGISGAKSGAEAEDKKDSTNTEGNGSDALNEHSDANKSKSECGEDTRPDFDDHSEKLTHRKDGNPEAGKGKRERSDDVSDECGLETIDEDEYMLSEEDVEAIKEELERIFHETKTEASADKAALSEPLDIPEMAKKYPGKRCLNLAVKANGKHLEGMYADLINHLAGGISSLTNQFKRIFRNDQEQRDYRASGRINVKRLQSSRMTSKVFDRKIAPANKSNTAVMLVVDVSGSMQGRKELMAKQAAVGLAEVFANVGINLKVMTFTADYKGYDAVHMHYINWHNTRNERMKLLNIAASMNNFDGYSIRYAGKLFKKRPEEHKLMIVISDGQPVCCSYRGEDGIADTRNAIKEASKYATVIGVAIDADIDELRAMYGSHFIHITDINQMFEQLGSKIKKEIKSW